MTVWRERREKVHVHDLFIKCTLMAIHCDMHIKLANFPNLRAVSIDSRLVRFGAANFCAALSRFIVKLRYPSFDPRHVAQVAATLRLPFANAPYTSKSSFEV